jgi:hypothetical protein
MSSSFVCAFTRGPRRKSRGRANLVGVSQERRLTSERLPADMPTDTELFKWFDGLREEKRIEILMVFITRPKEEQTLRNTLLTFWLKTESNRFLFGDPEIQGAG